MADDTRPPQDASAPGDLRKELERYKIVVAELQRKIKGMEAQLSTATTMAEMPQVIVTKPKLHETLQRFIRKVAMISQAEKAAIMLYSPEDGELTVLPPALGLTTEQVKFFRVRATEGVTGQVFREGAPTVFNDAVRDERTIKDNVAFLNVRNGVCVPLIIKKRDEEDRVVEQRTIGVLHVFNKRMGMDFNEEDLRLLQMLAEQCAAIISNAQLYIQLSEEKEELEETLQSLKAGVIAINGEGEVRLVNSAAATILGGAAPDFVGRAFQEVIKEERLKRVLDDALQAKDEVSHEISLGEGRETRHFQAQASIMRGDNGGVQHVVAILNDITDIRNVERMKTAFVSTVSHELRTPLTSIKGFIATLLEDEEGYFDDSTRREFYEIIDQQCDRLTRLISDLLNISRIESGRSLDLHLTRVNVVDVCSRIISAQQSYTDRHRLRLEAADSFPGIVCDQDKLEQILDNLLGNAIKYSPDGGEVKLALFDEGESVRMDVSDQGLGIPERHRDRIFERFHMVDDDVDHRSVKGTGIGLYLVKALAQAHRNVNGATGDVWLAHSVVDEGSTFSVRLPKEAVEGRAQA
ncbi:MAG: GAF domain-containing protein [Armatimonadetes bacterium]|nr:GAF domain-containing protein [Armatimonadota bacterium]